MSEENIIIKPYQIHAKDGQVINLAKKAAMICQYSICNPLHVSFEDGNFQGDKPMEQERVWNCRYREDNGERLYKFISEFLDEMKKDSKKLEMRRQKTLRVQRSRHRSRILMN